MNTEQGKIRARLKDGVIGVRVLIRHPMETGAREDPATGMAVPRHYIQEVVCEHNGRPVLTMDWGWGVSANPYLAFHVKNGAAGDTVSVRWTDDTGETGTLTTTLT